METFSGLWVDPLNMQSSEILIEDIVHSLSLQCRYSGHCKCFYSVAQHSVLVSDLCDGYLLQLFGLLHDAAETYFGDMIAPLKDKFPEYRNYEKTLQGQIFIKFCGRLPNPNELQQLKDFDTCMLLGEAKSMMQSCGIGWREGVEPAYFNSNFWIPEYAEKIFLVKFDRLLEELNK